MALLTTAEFLEHFDTDLGTSAVQRLLDDAERSIIVALGSHTSQIEWLDGLERLVFLARPAASITEVIETIAEQDTTLAPDDYSLENGGQLRRRNDGTNARTYWGDRIKVTYQPVDDTARRKRVQVDLVKLAVQFEGLKRSRAGDLSLDMGEYQRKRDQILSELAPALGVS